jgi:hypothetical protein
LCVIWNKGLRLDYKVTSETNVDGDTDVGLEEVLNYIASRGDFPRCVYAGTQTLPIALQR